MTTATLKRWALLCLLPFFAAAAKGESVGIIITATGLTNSSGGALPDNRLVQLIANTAGQSSGTPTVSSFVSGSDVVLASFALNSSTTGVAGSFQIYLTIDRSAFAGLSSGAPLILRWFDIPYSAGQTAPGAATYGQFRTSAVVDDSTSGWTLDFDGNNASLNFITASNGGSQPDTAGRAASTVLSDAGTVASVSPASGPATGGTTVTLTGTDFTGATSVSFGGTAATGLVVNSSTSITVTSPAASAGVVDITVTTPGGTSATTISDRFTFVAAPTVGSLSPTSGPLAGGTSVTLTGTNFTGATAVRFGATAATSYTVDSATSITATSPAGSVGDVSVTVTTIGGSSAGSPFTYVTVPTVVSPTSTGVATTTATLGGNVSSDGSAPVTERGVVFSITSTNANPQLNGTGVTKVTGSGTTGVFTVSASGLSAATTYTFAAYATNSIGTSYSPTGTFTTNPLAPVITSASTASGTYGHAITTYRITATATPASYSATGLPAGLSIDPSTGQITGTPTSAAGSPFSVTIGATNTSGTGTATLTFTITKAPLTVTAQPATRLYGAANPTFTATLSGFVNGQTLSTSGITGSAAVTTTATASTPVGSATLIPAVGSLASANYAFTTFTDSTLTITKAPLTLAAQPVTRLYGAANPTLTATITGFVNDENLTTSGITGSADVTTSATASSPVGTYAIIPATGSLTAANYAVTTFIDANLTVTKNAITVVGVTVANKTYDRTATATPDFTAATLRGIDAGDTANVTLVTTAATATFADKLVGSAKPVTISGLTLAGPSAANYAFEQPTGLTADITAKPLTVTGVTASARTYDATTAAPLNTTAAALVGVIDGDTATLSTTDATGTFETKTIGTAKPVTVTGLTISGADAVNYALTQPTGLTADVAAKNLTVTGVTAASKTYDGTTTAPLGFGSATLVGIAGSDIVTLASGGAIGTFASANAGTGQLVTIAGLSLAGVNAVNYTLSQPTTTGSISPASAAVAISDLNHVYNGSPKSATVAVAPSVAATIVYSGTGGVAPVNAGSYTVTATVADPNYSGSATATLVIGKANQTVAFTLTGTNFTVGSKLGLSATASSGLPVTFAVESGSASLSGSSLVITTPGTTTVRATQPGDSNYNPATSDQRFTGVASDKTSQTITFAQPSDRTTGDAAFGLSATATSGLPVIFTVVEGPAALSAGNLVTLAGSPGTVILRASQAGDATFAPAPDVTRSFVVAGRTIVITDTFFADLVEDTGLVGNAPDRGKITGSSVSRLVSKSGDIAAVYYPDTRRGTMLIVAPSLGLNVALEFVLNDDNSYTVSFSNAGNSLTLTGTLNGTTLTGRIPSLRVGFSTQVQSRTGSTSALAGYYQSDSVNSSGGGTSTIVGSNGQLLIVATTSTVTTGALGTVAADGTFSVSAPGATITGAVDAPSTSVSGTIVVPDQTSVSFSGVAATTTRTDRLINLSSRVRIAPSSDRTLITGFVIGGTGSKRVLLRAVGPTLAAFGVADALANPRLQLFDSTGRVLLENDDWSGADTAAAFSQTGAFALAPGTKDAALLTTLAPGAYTMQVTAGSEAGVAIAEIYDASPTPDPDSTRLINISTRGTVDTGDGLLIGGFVITGNTPKRVLIRGIGPTLGAFSVAGALTDPRLSVYSGSTLVAQNDDWSIPKPLDAQQTVATAADLTAAAQSVGAFALALGSKDAALVITLAPGAYSAQVTGPGDATGVALVEIYELP